MILKLFTQIAEVCVDMNLHDTSCESKLAPSMTAGVPPVTGPLVTSTSVMRV